MEKEISLSFCITTYNHSSNIDKLVREILSCPDSDIEVVVLDNGSTDDTLVQLGKVQDTRLKVHSNGENKGALFSMVNVLEKGIGRFLVFSIDRDAIDPRCISSFKSFLMETPNLAAGFCSYQNEKKRRPEVFPKGVQGIRRIAYKSRHPTGYFFNREYLSGLGLVRNYSDYMKVDLFPLDIVFADLCLLGSSAIYDEVVFTPASGRPVKGKTSHTTDGKSEKAFFSPRSRLRIAVNYTRHLANLRLPYASKLSVAEVVFGEGLNMATMGYKFIMGNENLCLHYNMKQRVVGLGELVRITVEYFLCYGLGMLAWKGNRLGFLIASPVFLLMTFFRMMNNIIVHRINALSRKS